MPAAKGKYPPVKLGVEVAGLKDMAKDIRAAEPNIRAGLKLALKQGADLVASEYRTQIGRNSPRIAATITTGSTLTTSYVKAGSKAAPHAAAFENEGRAGVFRHPVFGNRGVWVTQDAHPAAIAALQKRGDDVVALVSKAIDAWAAEAGFK